MKNKFLSLAFIFPSLVFGQRDLAKSLDSQFRADIIRARGENGFYASPDKKLDELAKKRVLALKKMFKDNWNKGVKANEFGHVFIGDNHFCIGFSHGIKKENLPSGFVYDKKDSALLPFSVFEESISGIKYSNIEENHTYPIILNDKEIASMKKNLFIPRGYKSIFEHYKVSKKHYESITGVSMKNEGDRKFGSYAEIFEVEPGKYILFQLCIFTGQ